MSKLVQWAERYSVRQRLCRLQAGNLAARARAFATFSKTTDFDCLTEDNLNRFLRMLEDRGLQAITVRRYRGDLLTLWNSAADAGHAPHPAGRQIYLPRVRLPVPECFDLEEARRILSSARTLHGVYDDDRTRRVYWTAAVYVAWETGLRRGDVWRVRRDHVRHGGLATVSHKTGRLTVHRLTPQAIEALEGAGHLGWPRNPDTFNLHFREILRRAGVSRGSFKWFRRASGSYVAAGNGDAAGAQHLGHASVSVFRQHYDARLVVDPASLPAPPALDG